MSRVVHTSSDATAAPGPYAAAGIAMVEVAADASNFEQIAATGADIIVARNSNSGSTARTVTITASADPFGRSVNIAAESIAAGAVHVFGPFPKLGWAQTDGALYYQGSHAEVIFSVIRL